jgi:peptide/nickel transport system substrate-binding protein
MELLRCCLVRTLLSYTGRPADEGGTELRPDLASSMPSVSADGLTWTFHLKDGLRYGPPLQTSEVVSADVIRGLEREGDPSIGIYPDYYSVIEGFDRFHSGHADSISGLEAPDDRTLIIRLVRPTGDLGYRLTLSAASPIPPLPGDPSDRAGVADGHADYGPFLISSGPYMLAGADRLDFSKPAGGQRPANGYRPQRITLVRNPAWEPASDDLRPALPARIELRAHGSPDSVLAATVRGNIDVPLTSAFVGGRRLERLRRNPATRDRLFDVVDVALLYIPMNVAMPPFDDVHMRRAVNEVVDRRALVTADTTHRGFFAYPPETGVVASHILPDGLEEGLLTSYDPYRTTSRQEAINRARDYVRRSKYDADGDGVCDDDACHAVRIAIGTEPATRAITQELVRDLRQLGIGLEVVGFSPKTFVRNVTRPWIHFAMAIDLGWFADYPDGATFFEPLLTHPGSFNRDLSLVGATPEQLRTWGYHTRTVPSIDGRVRRCRPLVGATRVQCWALLDRYVMQQVVPWIPFLQLTSVYTVSSRVENFTWDASTGEPSFNRISLSPDGPSDG